MYFTKTLNDGLTIPKEQKSAYITKVFFFLLLLQEINKKKYSETCVKQQLAKRPKIGFQDQLSLYAGQKYCIYITFDLH